jgi:PAS domain S-box-containing protein
LPTSAENPTSAPRPKRQQIDVLFLSSADPDLPDVAALIEQAETRILDGSNLPVHFSFEFLDSSSFADTSRGRATAAYLLQKYSGQTFDLLVAINEETLPFAEQMRAKFSPDGALLFFVVNPRNPSSWLNQEPARTGVIRQVNYLPTLQLALLQNPGTSHVIVVSGSSAAEKLDLQLADEQFRRYESNLDFQYLTDLQFSELGERLAHVPPASVILFLDFITDSHGEQFIPARILPAIAKSANAPIYGTFSSVVGGGVVGGSVADLGEVGRVLGNDGARILKGERPEKIPVITGDFQHYVLDWRQLHRWGFSEDQLPKEGEVRYWEYSPWEIYRWRILGLSALLLIETLLIVLLFRNIVKRKRAQQALRLKEVELAEAQRLARVGSWLWNTKNDALTWSEELYCILGLDPKLPLPSYKEFARFFTPESWARLRPAMENALQTGSVQELDLELVRADGSERWVTARGEAVCDAAGKVSYLRGTVQDVTERKRAEEELTKSEKRFRLMADSAPMLIWLSGPDTLATDFNKAWLEFTGRSIQQELGEGWVRNLHPDDVQRHLQAYADAFEKRQRLSSEYRMRRHDGQYRWLLDQSVPRFLDDGTFAGYVGYCIDITDQKETAAARNELSGRFLHAQEVERERIARELHDNINQRLALLANGLQQLEQTASDNQASLQKKQSHELWQLTNEIATDVTDMSHQLHPSKLHYLGLATAARELCREFSRQHQLEVECVARDLPQDLDETVSLSLFRTLQEALHNVVKHSQARHVMVELTRQSGLVELRVSDDGIGFNPEQARENHGLGLFSMRERLRSVGGEFSIRSKPSIGTQVKGTVPATARAASGGHEPAA